MGCAGLEAALCTSLTCWTVLTASCLLDPVPHNGDLQRLPLPSHSPPPRPGFAHRDLAPSNVLLTDDGRVLLCDFGQARRLGDGHSQADGEAPEREGALTPVVGTRW